MDNTIVKVNVEYSDGSSVTITGEPVDLTKIPTISPEQQDERTLSPG